MAKKTINYAKLFEPLIHYEPMVFDKELYKKGENFPLYALSGDSDIDEYAYETKDLRNRSADWKEAVKTTYSSPTNVQGLMITAKQCKVKYYEKAKGELWAEASLGTDKLLKGYLNNGKVDKLDNIITEHAKNFKITGDPAYQNKLSIVGSPLRNLYKPWTLSNIEYVFIDVRLLITDDLLKSGSKKVSDEMMEKYVTDSIGLTREEIEKKFPRLKFIAFLKFDNTDYENPEGHRILDKLFKSVINGESKNAVVFKTKKFNIDTDEFAIRTYYKFDKEILYKYAQDLKRNTLRKLEAEKQAKILEAEALKREIEASKSNAEKLLDKYCAQTSIGEARGIALQIFNMSKSGASAGIDIKGQFTEDGYSKYFG
ncbi:MAG: hypothetical protein IJ593_06005 [Lachnospiraceae bacterium]|nr:hypothetical protein [Lachnospiraceae bacterium]